MIFLSIMMTLTVISVFGQNGKKAFKAGQEFVEVKKYEDAIDQFTSAIAAEPSNADYYYERGQTYEKVSKYTEARADYEKGLVFAPKNPELVISLGVVCNATGNFEEALKFSIVLHQWISVMQQFIRRK